MTETYDELIAKIRSEHRRFIESAKSYVPKLYESLRNEGLSAEDARDRIEKDCVEFWKLGTIRDALPAECKDPNKVKAGKATPHNGSARFSRAESPTEESRQLIAVAASGDQAMESEEPQPSSTPISQDPTSELAKKEAEIQSLKESIGKLSNAITHLTENVRQTPAYLELQQEYQNLRQENKQLRTAIETNTLLSLEKDQQSKEIEFRIPYNKLTEAFVILRTAITKRKDAFITFDTSKNYISSRYGDQPGV